MKMMMMILEITRMLKIPIGLQAILKRKHAKEKKSRDGGDSGFRRR